MLTLISLVTWLLPALGRPLRMLTICREETNQWVYGCTVVELAAGAHNEERPT